MPALQTASHDFTIFATLIVSVDFWKALAFRIPHGARFDPVGEILAEIEADPEGGDTDLMLGRPVNQRKEPVGVNETVHRVVDGDCPSWEIRGWVNTGVDISTGIKEWNWPVLGSW